MALPVAGQNRRAQLSLVNAAPSTYMYNVYHFQPTANLADPVLAARRPLQQESHPLVEGGGVADRAVPARPLVVAQHVAVVLGLKALRILLLLLLLLLRIAEKY